MFILKEIDKLNKTCADLRKENKELKAIRIDAEKRATKAETRARYFARKVQAIDEEIKNPQFSSVQNLVNKIKTILSDNVEAVK